MPIWPLVVVRNMKSVLEVRTDLKERKQATCKVEHHVGEGPALCALALVVQVDLGNILNKRNCSFCIAHDKNCVPMQIVNFMPKNFKKVCSKNA